MSRQPDKAPGILSDETGRISLATSGSRSEKHPSDPGRIASALQPSRTPAAQARHPPEADLSKGSQGAGTSAGTVHPPSGTRISHRRSRARHPPDPPPGRCHPHPRIDAAAISRAAASS
jgi:hypothetical protein